MGNPKNNGITSFLDRGDAQGDERREIDVF
jgi:hypothetical protein